MRVPVKDGNIVIRTLERHPFSNRVFVPLNATHYLVAACPTTQEDTPDFAGLRAFIVSGSQATNYNANVWHSPCVALGAPGEILMFRWDDGSPDDTELLTPDAEITVTWGIDNGQHS